MHVLVTGHTGFKGAWLTLMLHERGHEVSGLALDPEPGALFEAAGLATLVAHDIRGDIRDALTVRDALHAHQPGRRDPPGRAAARARVLPRPALDHGDQRHGDVQRPRGRVRAPTRCRRTWSSRPTRSTATSTRSRATSRPTRSAGTTRTARRRRWPTCSRSRGRRASTGRPPRSRAPATSSAAATSAATACCPTCCARSPQAEPAVIRYPESVRPWQHVLDCLNGYLLLVDALLAGHGAGAWNLGPGRRAS